MSTAIPISQSAPHGRMSLREFQSRPERPPYHEFERGVLIPMASQTSRHQDVVFEITRALKDFARTRQLGQVFMEVDVFLPDGEFAYVPDVSFLSIARAHLHNPIDRKIHGAPDLIAEVMSSQTLRDRFSKFDAYRSNGVLWYWIVDSEALTIEEYHASAEGYIRTAGVRAGEEFRPRLFKGLALNLASCLCAVPPPQNGKNRHL